MFGALRTPATKNPFFSATIEIVMEFVGNACHVLRLCKSVHGARGIPHYRVSTPTVAELTRVNHRLSMFLAWR